MEDPIKKHFSKYLSPDKEAQFSMESPELERLLLDVVQKAESLLLYSPLHPGPKSIIEHLLAEPITETELNELKDLIDREEDSSEICAAKVIQTRFRRVFNKEAGIVFGSEKNHEMVMLAITSLTEETIPAELKEWINQGES